MFDFKAIAAIWAKRVTQNKLTKRNIFCAKSITCHADKTSEAKSDNKNENYVESEHQIFIENRLLSN
jgi:hypothetical protein